MTRWTQFVAMATAQLSGRHSLRDVASNMTAQARKLYHLGMSAVSRSSLSRVNASQPYQLYEALFAKLPACCRQARPLSSPCAEAWLLSLSKHGCKVLKTKGLTCDQTIQLTSTRAKNGPFRFRPACSRQAYWL